MKRKNIINHVLISTAMSKEMFPLIFLTTSLALMASSCKKFVEVNTPVTSTNTAVIYSTDATAASVMTGVYAQMSSNSFYSDGVLSLSLSPELSSDNLTLFAISNLQYQSYYLNNLAATYNGNSSNLWSQLYPIVYTTNAVIEGVNSSNTLSNIVKQQLLGEAYFTRAFCYFYLVNLYGEVPVVTTTDYAVNATIPRAQIEIVYQQIISDLKNAQVLLSDNYLDGSLSRISADRLRPNKMAANALLARVYLYLGQYTDAEAESTLVIANKEVYDTTQIDQVFLKNSKETIWSLQPVAYGENTKEALFYTLPSSGPDDGRPVYLSNFLMKSFEPGDLRKSNWTSQVTVDNITYPYPAKYKEITPNNPVIEYSVVLRISEQYLIRAEARTQLNNLDGANNDLNVIRSRSGLQKVAITSKQSLLNAIIHERQTELFCEWGHRWLDLKRTGQVNEIMALATPIKGGIWNSKEQLYPVPQFERTRNTNLSQNPGY